MSFKDFLFKHFEVIQKADGPPLSSISIHSDKVKASSLFIALKGQKNDGHHYLKQAIQKGAKALLVEKTEEVPPTFKGMVLKYKNRREILPQILNQFYDFPSEKLFTVGVTGSNGKTTFCYLTKWILSSCGWPTAIMGTVEQSFKGHQWPSSLTTPDSVEIFERLNDFVRLEAKALAMEVSSHALDQGRVDGVDFNGLVWTHLSQDHLDYHKNMENYFQTKKKLFLPDSGYRGKDLFCLINQDDPYGQKLKPLIKKALWTYGQNPDSDFSFQIKKMTQWNSVFELKSPFGSHEFFLPLTGLYNVYNAVSALASALLTGFKAKACAQALKNFPGVPGRMERVFLDSQLQRKSPGGPSRKASGQPSGPFEVVIDYAHSPKALASVLKALRPGYKKIILVFGCGGDRDKGKRPKMVEIALKLSDKIFLTSDNPRHEDPEQIIQGSIKNLSVEEKKQITQEPDRKKAIQQAIRSARKGDLVLIAGKGHEKWQIIGDKKIPFCDRQIALESLKNL